MNNHLADKPVSGLSSDLARTGEHIGITWDLIHMLEHNQEIKTLLEKAIRQGWETIPDPDCNPVQDLESYYAFIDRICTSLPWDINPTTKFTKPFDKVNQSMGCFYYIADQPLEELADKGYFHNSLVYHEPYRTWFNRMVAEFGMFLTTEDSWNEEAYAYARTEPEFHLEDGLYEDPENWKTFNDFFARRLRDPSLRPIAAPDDDRVVTAPADAWPQGLWQIDADSRIITTPVDPIEGIAIKTGTLTNIPALLDSTKYREAFAGGMLTHTFLDTNDYHRYHFPVSGTIREVYMIPASDGPGGVIVWEKKLNRYKEYHSDVVGWQSIETRGVIIMETVTGHLCAIIPVGMCQVSSVNFEDTVVPGAAVKKGDPMGCFLFGGSDIIMIFDRDAGFEMTAEAHEHLNMGEEYGRLK